MIMSYKILRDLSKESVLNKFVTNSYRIINSIVVVPTVAVVAGMTIAIFKPAPVTTAAHCLKKR